MRTATAILIALLVVVAFGIGLGIQAKTREFAPARIAFVDIMKVEKGYARATTIQQRLGNQADLIEAKFEKEKRDLKKRATDLDLMNRETREYAIALEKLETDKARIEFQRTWSRRKVSNDARDEMKEIYKSIQDAAERYARQAGIDAVFVIADREIPGETLADVKIQIAIRPVLHHSDKLDITEAVLGILNAEQPK